MKKVRGVTPGYEKMQPDSSHQQQQQQRMYQKGVRKNTESDQEYRNYHRIGRNTETATESAREYQIGPKIQNSLRLIFKG